MEQIEKTLESRLVAEKHDSFRALILQGTFFDIETHYFVNVQALVEKSTATGQLNPSKIEINPFTILEK